MSDRTPPPERVALVEKLRKHVALGYATEHSTAKLLLEAAAALSNPVVSEGMVERAAKALVDKLTVIFASSEYIGIFQSAMLHGLTYTGQNCADELAALQAALSTATSPVPSGDEDCQTCDGHRQIVDTSMPDEADPVVIACPNCTVPSSGMSEGEMQPSQEK